MEKGEEIFTDFFSESTVINQKGGEFLYDHPNYFYWRWYLEFYSGKQRKNISRNRKEFEVPPFQTKIHYRL
jgi:hypothetical protein